MVEVWKSPSRLVRLNRHKNQVNQFGLVFEPFMNSATQSAKRIVEYSQGRHGSGLPYRRESVWRDRWRSVAQRYTTSHAAEDEEIEEVHSAQNEQHHPNLHRQRLDTLLRRGQAVTEFES